VARTQSILRKSWRAGFGSPPDRRMPLILTWRTDASQEGSVLAGQNQTCRGEGTSEAAGSSIGGGEHARDWTDRCGQPTGPSAPRSFSESSSAECVVEIVVGHLPSQIDTRFARLTVVKAGPEPRLDDL
jgi:hypothetical protein